jgi:hypothetical protein
MGSMMKRLGARRAALVAPLVLAIAVGIGGFTLVQGERCYGGAIAHPRIGACVLPDSLVLEGDRAAVEDAIGPYGGQVVVSYFPRTHAAQFPVIALHELDEIMKDLERSGLAVRYVFLIEAFDDD